MEKTSSNMGRAGVDTGIATLVCELLTGLLSLRRLRHSMATKAWSTSTMPRQVKRSKRIGSALDSTRPKLRISFLTLKIEDCGLGSNESMITWLPSGVVVEVSDELRMSCLELGKRVPGMKILEPCSACRWPRLIASCRLFKVDIVLTEPVSRSDSDWSRGAAVVQEIRNQVGSNI